MKRIALTVATLSLLCATVLYGAGPSAKRTSGSAGSAFAMQEKSAPQEQVTSFSGIIARNGDRFVLRDDANKAWYDLDDQKTAGKFDGKKVRVTGTLDAANNTIRVKAIEEAAA
ncbi:MAG: DUF5818 domain-containing protein [Candidatus Acidiferrales bacterium]